MSSTPEAGWFDDPEHPSQYRYWDGNEWTAHRSPKQSPPPPPTSSSIPTSATETVSTAFTLFGQHWVSLLGLAAIAMLGFAAAAVAFVIGLILSFENPNTLTGPDFVFSPIGVVLWIVAAVGYLGVFAVMGPAFQARIEAGRIGQSTSVGACIGFGTRNWKRTLWRSILLMLTFFASYLVLIPLVLLGIVLGALGVFVAIVLGFAWFVAVIPALTLATAGVGIAPTGANVISQALSAARKDWALVSGAFYLAYLLVIGLGIASAVVGLIPILGIFANLAISFVSYTVFVIVQHFQWLRIGGEVDPAIAEMTGTA
ncbi:MAG: DUF2510 domain-containing protein [Actinobacteria bacterium]|nr:DUF2510 domain-containing protein [Actinomycetota bacterium]